MRELRHRRKLQQRIGSIVFAAMAFVMLSAQSASVTGSGSNPNAAGSGDAKLLIAPPPSPQVPPPAVQTNLSGSQIFSDAQGAIFKITTKLKGAKAENSHGSAFAVDASGYLITNYHVVQDALGKKDKYGLFAEGLPGTPPVKVIEVDPVNDLALIKVDAVLPKVLKIAPLNPPKIGDPLFSIGFPKAESITIISGVFNGEPRMGFTSAFAASMPLNPGMSGGPTFNGAGEVTGVNRAIMTRAQGISYLSPLQPLRALVDRIPGRSPTSIAPSNGLAGDWRSKVVDQIVSQENKVITEMRGQTGEHQKIAGIEFNLPLPGISCGQGDDEDKSSPEETTSYLFCRTRGLSLVDEDTEALSVLTVVADAKFEAKAKFPFHTVDHFYKDLVRHLSSDEGIKHPPQHCNVKAVHNQNKVDMSVRYCTVEIGDFKGIYSTYVKVEIERGGGSRTTIGQFYEGMSLPATTQLLSRFLESIRKDGVQ